MSYEQIVKAIKAEEDFFCFIVKNGLPSVIDYSRFDKKIDVSQNEILILDKQKKVITTINDMRKELYKIISYVLKISYKNEINFFNVFSPDSKDFHSLTNEQMSHCFDFHINSSDMELIINQVVIDVLFDLYIADESKHVTLNKYSTFGLEKHL